MEEVAVPEEQEEESPGISFRVWAVFKPPLFSAFLRFHNQEVELAAACVPIQFHIPTFLLEGVNTLGDLGKLVAAKFLNGALDLFDTAHTVSLCRLRQAQTPLPGLGSALTL